jgi:hypothetical protein
MRMSGTKHMRLAQRSRKENLADQRPRPFFSLVTRHSPVRPKLREGGSLATAFLIDRAYQLQMDVTLCRINETVISNRRWIAVSANRILRPIFATPNVDTSASRRLTCLPGEISSSQETRR